MVYDGWVHGDDVVMWFAVRRVEAGEAFGEVSLLSPSHLTRYTLTHSYSLYWVLTGCVLVRGLCVWGR